MEAVDSLTAFSVSPTAQVVYGNFLSTPHWYAEVDVASVVFYTRNNKVMEKLLKNIFLALRTRVLKGLSSKAVGVNNKGDVTKYFDRYCEKFIIEKLRDSGSKAVIISEELREPLTINSENKKITPVLLHYRSRGWV